MCGELHWGLRRLSGLVQTAINELNGPAGLDQSGVSLFKSPGTTFEATIKKKFSQYFNILYEVHI